MNIVFVISFLFFIVKVSADTGSCVTETDCPSGHYCLQSESQCYKLNQCAGLAPGTNVGSEIGGVCPSGSTPDGNGNCICQPNQCAPGTNLGGEIGGACPPGSTLDANGNCICQPNLCAGLAPGTELGCEIGGACPPGSKPDGAGGCIC